MKNGFLGIGALAFSAVVANSAYAGTISTFTAIDPLPKDYSVGSEYVVNGGSPNGEISGQIYAVGDGCDASQFSGFKSGSIASVTKLSSCSASVQSANAAAAGASAVVFVQYEIDGPVLEGVDFKGVAQRIPSITMMYDPNLFTRNQYRSSFEIISPGGAGEFVEFEDYMSFGLPKIGGVEADLFGVLNLGCSSADFNGITAGSVALINRGTCLFEEKIENAVAAGAAAAIIVNYTPGVLVNGSLGASSGLMPTMTVTQEIGWYLRDLLKTSDVRVALDVSAPSNQYYLSIQNDVPEPAALALFGMGCVGLGLMRRRRMRGR